jgi:hypothetical protein
MYWSGRSVAVEVHSIFVGRGKYIGDFVDAGFAVKSSIHSFILSLYS